MKIYLLRHGETKLNKEGGNFQGQIEVPLTEEGIRQAAETGAYFRDRGIRFDRIYCSPQGRAIQTAEAVTGTPREQYILDDRLKEMAYGALDGHRHSEMNPKKFHAFMEDAPNYVPDPGAESFYTLIGRSSDFLEELIRKETAQSVLVSAHGGTVRAMLVHLHLHGMQKFWSIPVGNCAWFELTYEKGKLTLTDQDEKADLNP